MKLTAQDLLAGGIAQEILPEPEGGARTDWNKMFQTVDAALVRALDELSKLNSRAIVQQRYRMFRAMGQTGKENS